MKEDRDVKGQENMLLTLSSGGYKVCSEVYTGRMNETEQWRSRGWCEE